MRTDPLNEPLMLAPAGTIDRTISIRRDAPQDLELAFSYATRHKDEVRALVGGYEPAGPDGRLRTRSGVDAPLQWSLSDPTGRVVASGRGETHGTYADSATEFWRPVASPIRVPPGSYRFRAAVLRDVPDFDGVSVRLRLGVRGGKVRNDWKSDVLFWGGAADFLIVRPLCVLFALLLLGFGIEAGCKSARAQRR